MSLDRFDLAPAKLLDRFWVVSFKHSELLNQHILIVQKLLVQLVLDALLLVNDGWLYAKPTSRSVES